MKMWCDVKYVFGRAFQGGSNTVFLFSRKRIFDLLWGFKVWILAKFSVKAVGHGKVICFKVFQGLGRRIFF